MLKRLIACLLVLSLLSAGIQAAQAASVTTLRSGSRGSGVKTLQTALKNLGFYTKAIDGIYGKGTAAAVRLFQSRHGLKTDGIAGPLTQAALYGGSASGSTAASSRVSLPASTSLSTSVWSLVSCSTESSVIRYARESPT